MIPHTKNQKQILAKFEELEDRPYKFKEIEEIMQNICPYTDRWLRNQLDKLTKDGFLKRGRKKEEDSVKPHTTYHYTNFVKLELPSFSVLKKCSNSTTHSNCSNNTNCSNREDRASLSNLNVLHVLNSEFNFKENIPIDKLTKDGFLKRGYLKEEQSIKPVITYCYNDVIKLELPSFLELKKCANSAHSTNNAYNANNANRGKKPSLSNMHDMHDMHSAFKVKENIPIEKFKQQTGFTDADIQKYKASGELAETKHNHITIL